MGWKASLIFIKNVQGDIKDKQLLDAMFQTGYEYKGDAAFEEAMNAEADFTYIARLNDLVIIGTADLPLYFMNPQISMGEQYLVDSIPAEEYCGISLQSTVNHWGYGIIQHGEKIRARGGNHEEPLSIEYGNPLPEEEELLSKLLIKEDGSRVYVLDGDEYTDDQVGENFVFEMAKRYTGHSLDDSDNPLDQLVFRRYERNPYTDPTTKASTPGELSVSDAKYQLLEPEQYGYNKVPMTMPDGSPADIKKYIQTALQNGACNPAYIFQLSPLVVIVYAFDIDCVVPLFFPKEYKPPFEAVLNQRLLSVNMYGRNNGVLEGDLVEGKNATQVWKTFAPHIADLYSDDLATIEEKKAAIDEEHWQKLPAYAKAYFRVNPNRYRLGLNGYSGFALVYKRPDNTPPPPQDPAPKDPPPPKKWWKLWGK